MKEVSLGYLSHHAEETPRSRVCDLILVGGVPNYESDEYKCWSGFGGHSGVRQSALLRGAQVFPATLDELMRQTQGVKGV